MPKALEQALDSALAAAFPDTDQGYPQTALTVRVAGIMAFVAAQLADDGYTIEYYNFHEVPTRRRVDFNRRQHEADGCLVVSAHCMSYKSLQHATDTALIAESYKYTLMDLRGERLVIEKGEDE